MSFIVDQNGLWVENSYCTISISSGTDATNPTLISWFQENATQIS